MTSFDEVAAPSGKPAPALIGGRWALALAAALLLAFAGVNIFHRLPADSPAALETIVQVPVPADNATDDHPDRTAPDPGDNP